MGAQGFAGFYKRVRSVDKRPSYYRNYRADNTQPLWAKLCANKHWFISRQGYTIYWDSRNPVNDGGPRWSLARKDNVTAEQFTCSPTAWDSQTPPVDGWKHRGGPRFKDRVTTVKAVSENPLPEGVFERRWAAGQL